METSESEACAVCHGDEEATGGTELWICRHVAEADEVEEEVVIFTRRVGDDEHKYCGDKDCPTLPVCGGCWDNLYTDGTPWWPESTTVQ
jgi:hypothetical protein